MSKFIHKIVGELTNDPSIKNAPLVKMLVESTNKSIALRETNSVIYSNLKNGLVAINESMNNASLNSLIAEFNKNEETPDFLVMQIAKEANLLKKIKTIKNSNAYRNPIIANNVDLFESAILNGTLDFVLCEEFVNKFSTYSYDTIINEAVSSVKNYVKENKSKFALLNTIFQMDSVSSAAYSEVSTELKNILIGENYTADSIKLKYGVKLPIINQLVSELRIIESQEKGTFTIGEGNIDTTINSLIAPAVKTTDGIIVYADNRFLSIREANGLAGNETAVYIDSTYKIAELNPNFVKEAYGNFYDLCEAYATLGFNKTIDGLGVESTQIKKFRVGFRVNESNELDMYLNGEKVEYPSIINLSEALALESNSVRAKLTRIVENISNLYNFDFIKEISSDRFLTEAMLLNLDGKYFICDKVNPAERAWKEVDEHEMYEFFKSKFRYDISPIFKTQIEESFEKINAIEEKKSSILTDITKLKESIAKLNYTLENVELSEDDASQLISIKESINATVDQLNKEYLELDSSKKKVN